MKRALSLGLLAALAFASTLACAEDKHVITLKVIDVVGNARRPAVVVEVTKVRMQLPTNTPTLAAAEKIQAASKKDPF